MKTKSFTIALASVAGLLSTSCDRASKATDTGHAEGGRLRVVAVNEPLAYFARRIGGELVDASCPAPADTDPAYWQPDDRQLAAIQQADLILLNGADYAHWLSTVSLPESKMVDTSTGFADKLIVMEEAVTHSHGPEGAHAHGGTAFTTWLDFDLARRHAGAVHAALVRKLDDKAAVLEAGQAALDKDLAALDEGFSKCGQALAGEPLLASHPVYQYFARAYGLNLRSIHWEPDAQPAEEEWEKLASLLSTHPARWMLWEGEPLAGIANRLKSLNVGIVVIDPCGAPVSNGSFLAVMQANRHQRAVRGHLVEALPGLADVLTAVQRAVFR